MPDMIDELFYGNLDLSMLEIKKGSDYNKKCSRVATLLEDLEAKECTSTAKYLGDAISDLDDITSRTYFSIGFRWGARMAIAILSEDPNMFDAAK